MDSKIELDKNIKRVLKDFKDKGINRVFTIDIIRELNGVYKNENTSAYHSSNARFGKYIKSRSSDFRIREINSGVKVKDDFGNKTSSSEWELM
ncbi:MAG: hypothetical protein WAT71_00485 [Ignavibacteria bacterium]